MYLYTRFTNAQDVPDRWAKQYANNYTNKQATTDKLLALPKPVDPDVVDSIIGNDSWTNTMCHECGAEGMPVVQVGQEPDYESSAASICEKCARKVLHMFKTHRKNLKENSQ